MMSDKVTKDPENKKEQKGQKDFRHGHRDRLRARFLKTDLDGVADYEVLELILFAAIPRRDVKPLAKLLIEHFSSFSGVMNAEVHDLLKVKGVSHNTVALIKAVKAAARLMVKEPVKDQSILSSWDSLMDYLHLSMAHEKNEQFRILFLDRKNAVIADEVQQTGTVDHTPVYPREVVKRTLELGATAIILVHNHPSGDPEPSSSDIRMTDRLVDIASGMGVEVHDHVIVSRSGYKSFKTLGLLKKAEKDE